MSGEWLEGLFGVAGKIVLVTGGGKGIGRAIASGFVRSGARVYICSRDAGACAATAAELSEHGECIALSAHLGTVGGCRKLAREFGERERRLDVLINNAGALWAAPLTEYPEVGWDKVFDLNVKAQFFLVQELLPWLEKAGTESDPARVINIGSIDGLHVPGHPTYAYSASKAAVHHLSRHLAKDLAERHVNVNVVAPGMYLSKMLKGSVGARGEQAMLAHTPLKRFVEDADMIGATLYLASRAGAYVTGAALPVDGGTVTTL